MLFSEPVDQLPEPLPSVEEIEHSFSQVLKTTVGRHVVCMGKHFVVKYGYGVKPSEGENAIFARRHLGSRVPRVFAIYQRVGPLPAPTTYIIMEYFNGRSLNEVWDGLDKQVRVCITEKLRKLFRDLRSIPPPDYFVGLRAPMLSGSLFLTSDPTRATNGIFETEDGLIRNMVARYRQEGGESLRNKADYYERVLPQVLRGNGKSVFTHADFQRKNVMVGPKGNIALIDWASAGWCPTYWEYALALLACVDWKDDWHSYVAQILDEYPDHFSWFHMIRTEVWES